MNDENRNKISVILPIRNEVKIIKNVIKSLLNQTTNDVDIEILAIDGLSNDGTDKIIKEVEKNNPKVKYLQNKNKKTPFALNEGIYHSTGNYVAILGAHCQYEQNYLQICYDELMDKKAAGCSGVVKPRSLGNSIENFLSLYILSSPFGVSSKSFRNIKAGYVHSIPYGVFNKKIIEKIGGYNEHLHRNQDNDLNHRLIASGHKLYITDKTYCNYIINYNLKSLYKYGLNNGVWNGKTLFISPDAMRLFHFVPAIFVAYVASLFVINVLGYFFIPMKLILIYHLPIMIYFVLGLNETLKAYKQNPIIYTSALPFIFFKFHFLYGLGTIKEILRNIYLKLTFLKK
jgi:succinoglycan biosynthesis protein ExoA